ncbi:hypothetical protein COM24_07525 [Bacillus toyonensis]|nr:hypothetical protein CN499_06150 [Bacillus thuringiensis]PGC56652.1 hypothetical protein COM24_07525 [Bacillus toyonensis]
MQLLNLILKFPFRLICKKKGHILQNCNGYFGIFAPKYTWHCTRCGIRSKGDYDSLKKKGMLYKPKD